MPSSPSAQPHPSQEAGGAQDASCPQTLDSKFFSFWTPGLTLVVCQGLSGLGHRLKAALSASLLLRFGTWTGFLAPQLADSLLWDFTL
ncbi:hypothetical protein CK820_G0022617 [Pan troglodytes]|uniref:Uncharacterized protein n=1 Tax=Pan troglodytes TaxID=9598 RepID=A0A2J8M9G7_PANTR|nr:hypothetical protein CK820_G0022617 [Pan troglodytes]